MIRKERDAGAARHKVRSVPSICEIQLIRAGTANEAMRRLAIAYMLRGQAADIVNALRGKYDKQTAAAIDAHVTVAGPCDTDASIVGTIKVVGRCACNADPFELTITRPDTFLPTSSTSFFHIEPKERLVALHDQLVAELGWKEAFPYIPHVTITEYLPPAETVQVAQELDSIDIRGTGVLDAITLLQKGSDGRWVPLRQFRLGRGDILATWQGALEHSSWIARSSQRPRKIDV